MEKKQEKIPFRPRFKTETGWGDEREIYEPGPDLRPKRDVGILQPEEELGRKEFFDGYEDWHEEPRKRSPQQEPEDQKEDDKEKKKRGLSLLTALLLSVVVLVASAEAAEALDLDVRTWIPFLGSAQEEPIEEIPEEILEEDGAPTEEDAEANTAAALGEQVTVLEYDINYSQSDRSFAKEGVDVLLRVENGNEAPICRVHFTVLTDAGTLRDVKTEEEEFTGEGYVEADGTGFLYGKLYLAEGTKHQQGTITITEAETCQPLEGYRRPSGKVCGYHRDTDTYDVKVTNQEQSVVDHGQATVIAVQKNYQELASSWGAGPLPRDLEPGEETVLKDVLYNPGFKHFEEHEYQVFIIDRAKYADPEEPVL